MNIMKLTSTLEEEIPSIARKPKMHMLQHLPGDVNNFGPSSCFNTERYFYLSIYLSIYACATVCMGLWDFYHVFIKSCVHNYVHVGFIKHDKSEYTEVNDFPVRYPKTQPTSTTNIWRACKYTYNYLLDRLKESSIIVLFICS